MPFPFVAPLQPWIVDIMTSREDAPLRGAYKNPYAVLTSGALVVKGTPSSTTEQDRKSELIKIITNPSGDIYRGCILSNNINNLELTYSLGEAAVGIDFTGKVIKVAEGEKNKKIPTPLIESIEVDTDGANNTLKTARVNLRIFSLKQLEMFELFFMKPGMHVLLEYGDATLLKENLFPKSKSANDAVNQKRKYNSFKDGKSIPVETHSTPQECLYKKEGGYDAWCEQFSQFFRADTTAFAQYLNDVERSLGSYDRVGGKITDYSFSVEEDGTYTVNIEISAGNQVSLAIPNKSKGQAKGSIGISSKTDIPERDQIINLMIVDLGLESDIFTQQLTTHPEPNKDWKDDWFNFLKVNTEQKNTTTSEDAYVSLRFIIHILMNYAIAHKNVDNDFFEIVLPEWETESGQKVKRIPVTSNQFIMSSNDDVIFPTNELPIVVQKKGTNTIEIQDKNKLIGTINGYNFHTNEKLKIPLHPMGKLLEPKTDTSYRLGDACNIFIKYKTVVKLWNSSTTRIDFLESILNVCNQNSYGLFTLIYGVPYENGKPTVLDAKAAQIPMIEQNSVTPTYRFKPGTIKSNVLEFSFNFELSTLVAGRQVFNSGKLLAEAKNEASASAGQGQKPQNEKEAEYMALPYSVYKSVDNSNMGNADGWWSINNVELKRVSANLKRAQQTSTTEPDPTNKEGDKATTEVQNLTELIDGKSIKFLFPNKEIKKLIYKDASLINNKINVSEQQDGKKNVPKKATLAPIDVSIVIDGFSGFSCGQYFEVDGIPEIYNKTGVFQITNIKHSLSTTDWKTNIEASFLVVDKKK